MNWLDKNMRFGRYSEFVKKQMPDITAPIPATKEQWEIIMAAPTGKVIDMRYIREALKEKHG